MHRTNNVYDDKLTSVNQTRIYMLSAVS